MHVQISLQFCLCGQQRANPGVHAGGRAGWQGKILREQVATRKCQNTEMGFAYSAPECFLQPSAMYSTPLWLQDEGRAVGCLSPLPSQSLRTGMDITGTMLAGGAPRASSFLGSHLFHLLLFAIIKAFCSQIVYFIPKWF